MLLYTLGIVSNFPTAKNFPHTATQIKINIILDLSTFIISLLKYYTLLKTL